MSNDNNYWQLVFNQSRVNGAEYFGDRLPSNSWEWPKNTFLQKRLDELKKRRWEVFGDAPQANRQAVPSVNPKRRHVHAEQPNWLRTEGASLRAEEH